MRDTKFDQPTSNIHAITDATEAAAELLTARARRQAAISYLRQRGIDAAALPAQWLLGYAPPGWTRLVDALSGQVPDQILLDAGLARRSSRGTLIDTFRDRVIFPIRTSDGQIAGFIGRDLSGADGAPKYLNTARTALFDKSAMLYGLHEGRTVNPGAHQPVVVEGPLDVLAIAARAAVDTASDLLPVAACGTALTASHARQVAAVAQPDQTPVVVAMDGDAAGCSAAVTAGNVLRASGADVRVAVFAGGIDPAEYLARPGSILDTFRDGHALPLLTVQVQQAIAAQGDRMQWIEGRLAAGRIIASQLATYPVQHAAGQIGWISHSLDLDAATFTFELAAACRRVGVGPQPSDPAAEVMRGPAEQRPVPMR